MASLYAAKSEPYYLRVFRLYQEQQPKLMCGDVFKFYTNVLARTIDSNSNARVTTLLRHSQDIGCKSFFKGESLDFLDSHLSHPNLPSKLREEIIQGVIYKIVQMFELDESFDSDSDRDRGDGRLSDLQSHEFCLVLEIVMDTQDE